MSTSALKIIAILSLIQYVFLKPYLISQGDGSDVIGYCLCSVVFAFFSQIFTNKLTDEQWQKTRLTGIFGAVLGYAWLLLGVKHENRQIHHLLVANLAILAGVMLGAYTQRGKKGGKYGGGRTQVGGGGGGPRVQTSRTMDSSRFLSPYEAGYRNGAFMDT